MAEAGHFHLDNDQLQLLAGLARSPEGKLLVDKILEPWLRHTDRRLRTAINDYQQLQGQACALERLIDMLTVKPQQERARRPVRFDDDSAQG